MKNKASLLSPEHRLLASFAILPKIGIKRRRSCSLGTVTTVAEKACRAPFVSTMLSLTMPILPSVMAFPSMNIRALLKIRLNTTMKSSKEELAVPLP